MKRRKKERRGMGGNTEAKRLSDQRGQSQAKS